LAISLLLCLAPLFIYGTFKFKPGPLLFLFLLPLLVGLGIALFEGYPLSLGFAQEFWLHQLEHGRHTLAAASFSARCCAKISSTDKGAMMYNVELSL
jgi:hypothetical protein